MMTSLPCLRHIYSTQYIHFNSQTYRHSLYNAKHSYVHLTMQNTHTFIHSPHNAKHSFIHHTTQITHTPSNNVNNSYIHTFISQCKTLTHSPHNAKHSFIHRLHPPVLSLTSAGMSVCDWASEYRRGIDRLELANEVLLAHRSDWDPASSWKPSFNVASFCKRTNDGSQHYTHTHRHVSHTHFKMPFISYCGCHHITTQIVLNNHDNILASLEMYLKLHLKMYLVTPSMYFMWIFYDHEPLWE